MRNCLTLLALVVSALNLSASAPWAGGPLRVSADGRYFQQPDGSPFFWLGDTTWLITQKLTREEVKTEWFKESAWLDFHMFTSGHRRYDQDTEGRKYGEDNWRYVFEARAADPQRPVLDAEPAYENTPQGLHKDTEPYWNAADARRYAYWSVFAGAAGHTYGGNSVRQVYIPAEKRPASGAKGFIMERLETDGARQMAHLKKLILSRPFFERVNDQSLAAGDEGEKYDRVLVTRGDGYVLAYIYTGRTFTLQLEKLGVAAWQASWFNPRTGEVAIAGSHTGTGSATFDPPGDPAPGNDWVLVLDDAARNFKTPGAL